MTYAKTRGMISQELYNMVYGKDIRVLHDTMRRLFKKKTRVPTLEQLTMTQLEELLPALKAAYAEIENCPKPPLPLEEGKLNEKTI